MMIRALGEHQRSTRGVFAPQPVILGRGCIIHIEGIQCTLGNDDILQWNCGHKIMFRAVQWSSPQHSRHSSLLKQ